MVRSTARGIGAAIARRFAREGAAVLVAANEPLVEQVAGEITAAGGTAAPFVADVTDPAQAARLYDAAEQHFGRVDVSVQNAGVITIARIEDMTEAEWDKVLAVTTKGVFLCCQGADAGGGLHQVKGERSFIVDPHAALLRLADAALHPADAFRRG
ncbi:SDR family NAD(P)-dependent oxidoreductase [Geminicoccaceae bacterium SYSU G07066]|uniref:SDR family NAD(P)-dependent oxidoreductase n=1 Tax=Benzoatithermus flavus TaxID=3108223 RepID=A0ABU8XY69_9PROT